MQYTFILTLNLRIFDILLKLGVQHIIKFLKCREDLIFEPHKIYPCETTIVINKCNIVFVSHPIEVRGYPPYICENHVKKVQWYVNIELKEVKYGFCSYNKIHI